VQVLPSEQSTQFDGQLATESGLAILTVGCTRVANAVAIGEVPWHANITSTLYVAFVTIEGAFGAFITLQRVDGVLFRTDRACIWIVALVAVWRAVRSRCHGRIDIRDDLIAKSVVENAVLVTLLTSR